MHDANVPVRCKTLCSDDIGRWVVFDGVGGSGVLALRMLVGGKGQVKPKRRVGGLAARGGPVDCASLSSCRILFLVRGLARYNP